MRKSVYQSRGTVWNRRRVRWERKRREERRVRERGVRRALDRWRVWTVCARLQAKREERGREGGVEKAVKGSSQGSAEGRGRSRSKVGWEEKGEGEGGVRSMRQVEERWRRVARVGPERKGRRREARKGGECDQREGGEGEAGVGCRRGREGGRCRSSEMGNGREALRLGGLKEATEGEEERGEEEVRRRGGSGGRRGERSWKGGGEGVRLPLRKYSAGTDRRVDDDDMAVVPMVVGESTAGKAAGTGMRQ